jgi:VTC domain
MEERLQHQRFERKYFITERQAIQIREFVKSFLVPDEFSRDRPELSYPVHSLYLDSNSLMTYWATVHCEQKRFKLRVRYYDDDPASPLYFEIKRRDNECVFKQRGAVDRRVGGRLMAGQLPGPDFVAASKPHHLAALQRFCYLMQRLNARPTVHVAYLREAWVSPRGNALRVTMDRQVRGEPRSEPLFNTKMDAPVYPFGKQLVLELKFTDRFPDWFMDMAKHFDLVQTDAPKYCASVLESGQERVTKGWPAGLKQKLARIMNFC